MKLISWNVNGLRACMQKGFEDFFNTADADISLLRNPSFRQGGCLRWSFRLCTPVLELCRKSGAAIFTKKEPLSVTYGIGIPGA